MLKRIIASLFCLLFIFVSIPIFGFTDFFSVPVYAGTGPDSDGIPVGYSPAGLNDQVDAFRSYCKSRNLFIEGSALDTVSSVTSSIYQHLVADAGLDINQLQNEIYKRTQDNAGAQWFFTTTGIAAYNRLFAEFLQNNNLAVGDSVEEQVIYSGRKFTDDQGTTCTCFEYNNSSNLSSIDSFISMGSPYIYSLDDIIASPEFTVTRSYNNISYTITSYLMSTSNRSHMYGIQINNYSANVLYSYVDATNEIRYSGYPAVGFDTSKNNYYIGVYINLLDGRNVTTFIPKFRLNVQAPSDSVVNVFVTTNNTTINNNNYEGDTYITNEGDVINNPTPGGKDPGWDVGGGQGSYEDNSGNSYTINFPDFELPDLNIDWSIQGLGNKFPFSIPFDIVSLVTVLNAEPEAPRFQGTVNFGFTTWDYDINLQQFDTVAQVCRIAELLLLVFGLILITRSIIKG